MGMFNQIFRQCLFRVSKCQVLYFHAFSTSCEYGANIADSQWSVDGKLDSAWICSNDLDSFRGMFQVMWLWVNPFGYGTDPGGYSLQFPIQYLRIPLLTSANLVANQETSRNSMGVSIKGGNYPKWLVFDGKSHLEMDDKQGYPYDSGHHHALTASLVADHFALSPVAPAPCLPWRLAVRRRGRSAVSDPKGVRTPGASHGASQKRVVGDRWVLNPWHLEVSVSSWRGTPCWSSISNDGMFPWKNQSIF